MRVLIVEDEYLLALELADRLASLDKEIEIAGRTDSILSTVEWLQHHECDLMFLDVHLSDGLSFSIFDRVEVKCPVIFTTAYDHYAIKAFEVNSIGYLLKPIDEEDLRKALLKYKQMRNLFRADLDNLLNYLGKPTGEEKAPISRIMLSTGKAQMAMNVDEIAYFLANGRYLYAVDRKGDKYFCDGTLYKLEEELDTRMFFRLNRKYIVNFSSVAYFTHYSKSRVKVKLIPQAEEEIIVSADKVKEFKKWLVR